MELIAMQAPDGAKSEARLFKAQQPGAGLLVLPAMGVNARAYDRLGESLADSGITAMVVELRGGGSSSVRAKRGVDYGYAELLDDMTQHLEVLRTHVSGPVSVLGHSLGGHLATVGLARWLQPGAKLIVIASGTVHHRAWSGIRSVGVLAGTQLAQVIARGLGFYPGHRLGFGGLQGKSLIIDWSNSSRTGVFTSQREGALEHRLEELEPDVLALHVQGDTFAPLSTTEALLRKLKKAKVKWVNVTPPEQPRKMNPHFRWMKDPTAAVVAIAEFLQKTSGRGPTKMMLRPATEADLEIFYEHQRDPQSCEMAAFKPRDHEAFLKHWRTNILGSPSTLTRTIVEGDQVTGYVASFTQQNDRLACYWIGREHWGRGLASAALTEFIKQVELTRPLDAFVAISNLGSIRVLDKAGFTLVPNSKATGEDGVEEVRYRLSAPARP